MEAMTWLEEPLLAGIHAIMPQGPGCCTDSWLSASCALAGAATYLERFLEYQVLPCCPDVLHGAVRQHICCGVDG